MGQITSSLNSEAKPESHTFSLTETQLIQQERLARFLRRCKPSSPREAPIPAEAAGASAPCPAVCSGREFEPHLDGCPIWATRQALTRAAGAHSHLARGYFRTRLSRCCCRCPCPDGCSEPCVRPGLETPLSLVQASPCSLFLFFLQSSHSVPLRLLTAPHLPTPPPTHTHCLPSSPTRILS